MSGTGGSISVRNNANAMIGGAGPAKSGQMSNHPFLLNNMNKHGGAGQKLTPGSTKGSQTNR